MSERIFFLGFFTSFFLAKAASRYGRINVFKSSTRPSFVPDDDKLSQKTSGADSPRRLTTSGSAPACKRGENL